MTVRKENSDYDGTQVSKDDIQITKEKNAG